MFTLDGQTKTFGILGCPVSHSASPKMHLAAYKKVGLNAAYLPFLVVPEQLEQAINGLRALNISGVNVTIPYKETVMPFLDEIDPAAKRIGAVNTIVNDQGKLIGYNTDGLGLLWGLDQELGFQMKNYKACILGTGGSAKSIAVSLLDQGASELVVAYRTAKNAVALHAHLQGIFTDKKISIVSFEALKQLKVLETSDIVIQTTPLGMSPNIYDSCIDHYEWVHEGQYCVDIIYNPEVTVFLKNCLEKGAYILGGAAMLAGQGCLAFELMTGKDIAYTYMKAQL